MKIFVGKIVGLDPFVALHKTFVSQVSSSEFSSESSPSETPSCLYVNKY